MNFKSYISLLHRAYQARGHELTLSPPAQEVDIASVERTLGHAVPVVLRELWLVANGTASGCPVFLRPGYLTGYSMLSTQGALEAVEGMRVRASNYASYQSPEPWPVQVAQSWFEPQWFPFGAFNDHLLLLDHVPSDQGQRGQVISFTHDPDRMQWHAPSFAEFLARGAAELDFWMDEVLL